MSKIHSDSSHVEKRNYDRRSGLDRRFNQLFSRGKDMCVCGHWRELHWQNNGICHWSRFYDGCVCPCINFRIKNNKK